MENTWKTRDYPALAAAIAIADGDPKGLASVKEVAVRADLSEDDARTALRALAYEDPPLLVLLANEYGVFAKVSEISGYARRVVGAWPKELTEPKDRPKPMIRRV